MRLIELVLMLVLAWPCLAVRMGRVIPPSGRQTVQCRTKMEERQVELERLLAEHLDSGNGRGLFGLSKAKQDELLKAQKRLSDAVDEYLLNNACLRYYLKDFVDFSELKNEPGIMIALGVKLDMDEKETKEQELNLNVMDRAMNTMRRTDDIRSTEVHLAVEYPIRLRNREAFAEEYIDVCFENLRKDMSWQSQPNELMAMLDLDMGMAALSLNYKGASGRIGEIQQKLNRANELLESTLNDMHFSMSTSEKELRNINEDTYTKQTIYAVATLAVYTVCCGFEMIWLKKYLSSHHYL